MRISFQIHWHTKPSITLMIIGVRLIGLRSVAMLLGGDTLGEAVTFANIHSVGMKPSRMDAKNMAANGLPSTPAKSQSNHEGIQSGPGDLLQSITSNAFSIVSTVTW